MSQQPRVHSFCWVELAAHDAQAVKPFYHKLFNWNYHDTPMPPEMGGSYIIAMQEADAVGAMFSMAGEMKEMQLPAHWASYVLVDNCDETAKKAASLGAVIIKDSFDVTDAGRMAVLRDPCGAMIHLWEKKRVVGASAEGNKHGAFCWHELMVADPKKAMDFYGKLFGWNFKSTEFDNMTYHSMINADGQPFGGIMALPKEMPNIPPHWNVYFTVDKLASAMELVKQNGGTICVGPHDVHGVGEFAICLDPQGAGFAMFEFKGPCTH